MQLSHGLLDVIRAAKPVASRVSLRRNAVKPHTNDKRLLPGSIFELGEKPFVLEP
jgi:hypothetical protein